MAAEEKWYFSKEHLENSPSRKCNIDSDKELSYRQQAANFIQDVGQRLHVTQLCINTAIVYMHRFYVFHSFTQFHRYSMASAALFLAAKVEELPRKLEHVVKVAQICLHKEDPGAAGTAPDIKSELYVQAAHDLVFNENVLLQTLGFDVAIDHPHTHVVRCCQLVKASKDLAQTSYFLASNSLHLTTMCLQYKPAVVACFCIYLACKWSNWKIPPSSEGKQWFMYVDESVTDELLDELTAEFMVIYNKCPSRLKKKIESMSNLGQSSGNQSGSSSGSNYNSPMALDPKKLQAGPHKEGDPYHSKSHPSKSGVPHPHRPHPDPNKERERQMSGSSSMPHHPKPTDPTKHPPPQNHRPPHGTVPPQHRSQHHRPTDPKLKPPPPGHPHANRPPQQPYPHPRPEQRPDPYRDPYRRDITAPRDPTFPGKEPPKDLFAPSNITTEREMLKEQQMRERHNAAAGVDSQTKDLFRERPPDPHKHHLFSNNSEFKKIDPNKLQRPDPNRHKGDKVPRIDPTKKPPTSVKVNSHPPVPQPPQVVKKVETPGSAVPRNGNHVSESEKVVEPPVIQPIKVKSIFSPEKELPKDLPSPSKKSKPGKTPPSSKKDLTAEFSMIPPVLSPFGSPPPAASATTPNSKNRNRTSSSSSEAELMVVINKLENIKGYEHMMKDQKNFKVPKSEEPPRESSPIIKEEKPEVKEEVPLVNGIETDPAMISNLLKEVPPVNHLTEIKKEEEIVPSQEGHHRSEKKKKKDKHKHKDKDRSRDEKKKKHKDKDKDRSKNDLGSLKITITKDKITPPPSIQTTPTITSETTSLPTSLKIKIPKDRIKTDTLPMLNNSNRSSLKIKISKDKIVDESSGSRKRERDNSESQGPSKVPKTSYKSSSSSSQNGRNYNNKVSLGEGGQVGGSGSLQPQPQWSTTPIKLAESKYHSKVSGSNKLPPPT